MFTCKPENRVGVYMLVSKRTGDTYIGASSDLPMRLRAHEGLCDRQSWGNKSNLPWKAAFKNSADMEFRILEFVKAEFKSGRRGGITIETERCLLNREKFWIAKLNPTLNKRIETAKRRIEDLPFGAPNETVARHAIAK